MVYRTFVSHIMQQGDCNAPSRFQHTMNTIFHDYIGIFLHVYQDDPVIYSNSVEDHQNHLTLVFACLCKHKFYLGFCAFS